MKRDTLIIMTGGTIDAESYRDPKRPPKDATMLEHSMIPHTLAGMGLDKRCDFLSWKAKDSKYYTDGEMRDLAAIIRTSEAHNIIITHGTDAMAENSRRIQQLLAKPDMELRADAGRREAVRGEAPVAQKRVIFTGAMMPLANGPESDAYQNLEYIFKHIDKWKPGVRVVMHSTSYEPVGLSKNFDTLQFQGRVIPDAPKHRPAEAMR